MRATWAKRGVGLLPLLAIVVLLAGATAASAAGRNGTTLSAAVTAKPYWTTTYSWTIDKRVSPATWSLFRGDTGTSRYTVAVSKDNGTAGAWLRGVVTVTNGGAVATENLTIIASVTNPSGKVLYASRVVDVSGNAVLDPGETGAYTYIIRIPDAVGGATHKVTADVSITNHSGRLGSAFGPRPSASTVLPPYQLASSVLVHDSATVSDTNGSSWTVGASDSRTYERTFSAADEGDNDNTAKITYDDGQAGPSDSATVHVDAYELQVAVDAATGLTRTWAWAIDKTADQSTLALDTGATSSVAYTVALSAASADGDWRASGAIDIANPAPVAAVIESVGDVVSPDLAAAVTFDVTFPYTLASGETLSGSYQVSLPDGTARLTTATATLRNHGYDGTGNATAAGTTDFSGEAAVDFASVAVSEIDESVTLSDSLMSGADDWPKTVAASDVLKSYTYAFSVGPYALAGGDTLRNTAQFLTGDTGATGSDVWDVAILVTDNDDPDTGGGPVIDPVGTYSAGYWSTHSRYGPAGPYNPTWTRLGEDTTFYLSGASWYAVMTTSPKGNPYYILAFQFIGATLNGLNGADTSAVATELAAALDFFRIYRPDSALTAEQRTAAVAWAATLEQYNTGVIGPGHAQ